jgi:ribulose 1,5-bisphosphate carboxylase large subunit-like protein
MIECYLRWCQWHHQDEPFCTKATCIASESDIDTWLKWRNEENAIVHKKIINELSKISDELKTLVQ